MPDIDREKLAYAVAGRLQELGRAEGLDVALPYAMAQRRFAGVSAASLSRIANAIPVSAAVMLAVCRGLGLDPFAFLDADAPSPHTGFGLAHAERKAPNKALQGQGVAVGVKRETP